MPTLLKIGADVTGAEKVERLAKDLREAANATDSLAKSSQKGNTEFKTMSAVMGGTAREAEKLVGSISQTKAVLAGFKTSLDSIWSSSSVNVGLKEFQTSIKEVGRDLSYSRQQLSDFITTSGQYATLAQANAKATHATSVALRAEEAAMDSLLRIEGNYVAAKAKELLLTDKAAIALTAETAAVNDQIAAYQKLNASGKMGNYEKGFDYVTALKEENASIAAQERGLATLAQQFSALKAVRSTLKQGDYAAQIAAENASIAAQERGLKELEAQFRKTAAARAALKQGSYAVSDYAQSGRDKLSAGNVAGGYDYAKQLKAESVLYDEVTGKAKNYPPILTKLGQAWDDAGKKSSVFHNLMRGASGAMGTLWLTYGQMIPMIAGFATAAAALKSVNLATEFDYTTRMIQALSDGSLKGAEGLGLIRDSLLGIKDVVSTPQQLAAGLLELARAGVDAKEGLVELEEISRFATLAELDLGKAVELLVGQTKAFKDVDMSQAANIVAKVADDTSVSISQMTEAFKNTTELGTVMGAKFLDVATALGIMADHGIRGASAGTSLRTSMLQLISPTESAKKALDKYFVTFSAIDPITGKVKDLKTMVGELSKATSHLSSGELTIILEKLTGNRSIKAIGALINATREEEKQLAKTSEAVKLHSKTWTEAEQVYKQAMGGSADAVSYLKKVTDDMAESGQVQFKKLRADFERLAIGSVNMKGVTEAIKEFRGIVNDPAMKQSLSFLLEVLTKIAGFSFKNASNALIELRNLNDAFHGKVAFSQVLGATSGEDQKKLAEDIDRGTEELAKSISNAQDKVKSLQAQITKGVDRFGNFLEPEELDKLNTKLETAKYQLAGFKETYDKAVNGPKLTDSLGLNKAEIETAIGYAETRIKTLQKMVSTGKAPVGGYLDNEGLANANKDLVEAKQHLLDLQAQLASVGQAGSKGFSDVGSAAEETAGSVAADMERMYADIEEKSGSYLAQWENSMLKARDEIQIKLLTPGSDKYEPPLAGEDGVAYMQRIKEIADGWDEANRKMNESEQIKAKLKDLKPASDTLKQLASDTAQMEAIFAEQKATLEAQAIENQTDYEKGLKSHSQYWDERLRITEQALTAELGLREAAMREAQAAYDQYVTNFGTDQADEELVGKQIDLQKKLAEAQKAVAEIKGKILNTQKQSNAEADKEANTYAVEMLRAQAELLNLKGEIYSEDALIYEATLKQLQADQLSLQYGDEQLNAIKLQVIELKKLEAATKTPYEAMQKGMKEAVYSGKEMAEDIQRATENAFDSMTDAIVDFVKTGKMNFSDLTDSILTDLLTIMVRANITNTILSALGMSSYTGLGSSNQTASALGMDTSQLSSGGGFGNMMQSSIIGEGYDYVSGLFSGSAAGSSAAYSSAAYGSSAFDLGSVYGEGAYGSAASELGSSAPSSGWSGLSTTAQTGWSSGALAFVASLLAGEDVDVAAVKGVGAGGGAYLGAQAGSYFGPVGTAAGGVIGGILGALGAGSLLDNGPDTFQAGYMSDAVGVNYDAVKGMVPTTTQFTGGDTDSQIAAIYAPAMRAIQQAFDDNVTALTETLPEEMSASMIESLSNMDLLAVLDQVSAGEIEVGNVDTWLAKVAEDYAEGLSLKLGEAFGNGLAAFISAKGAEGLVGDSAAWAVLTDTVKENITNSFQEAATQIAGGDIDAGLSSIQSVTNAIAAIESAMAPITEIIATDGLTDYEKSIRSINLQFDSYRDALKAAGVDMEKYTDLEKARGIALAQVVDQDAVDAAKALAGAMTPVNEIIATSGMSDYELEIRSINQQFDDYAQTVKQSGGGVFQLIKIEKARAIQLADVVNPAIQEAIDKEAELAAARKSILDEQIAAYESLTGSVFGKEERNYSGMSPAEIEQFGGFLDFIDGASEALSELRDTGAETSEEFSKISEMVAQANAGLYNGLAQSRLMVGDASGALAAAMSNFTITLEQFNNEAGQFVASAFNSAYLQEQARLATPMYVQVSGSFLEIPNAGSAMGLFGGTIVAAAQDELATQARYTAREIAGENSYLYDAFAKALGEKVESDARLSLPGGPGLAGVYQAQAAASAQMVSKYVPGFGLITGADPIAWAEAMSALNYGLNTGKVSTDEFKAAVEQLNEAIPNGVNAVELTAEQMAEVAEAAAKTVSAAGVASINYYFGQLTGMVDKLAESSDAASQAIESVTNYIGLMNSAAQAFGISANAAGYRGGETTEKGQLVADAANLISGAMTTRQAAEEAALLAKEEAFVGVAEGKIRDLSLMLEGVTAYDSESLRNAFVRLSAALGEGVLTQQQYAIMINDSLDLYEDIATKETELANNLETVLSDFKSIAESARSLADGLLVSDQSTLSDQLKFVEAQRQYRVALAGAMDSDTESMSNLSSITSKMLELGQNTFTDKVDYDRLLATSVADIRNVESVNERRADNTQAQLDALKSVKDEITTLREEMKIGDSTIAANTASTTKRLDEFATIGMRVEVIA